MGQLKLLALLASTAVVTLTLTDISMADDEIVVGMSTALSGPAEALGNGMKSGIEAHFAEVNSSGGIAGKKLRLVAEDDGYEPPRASTNMTDLIDNKQVLAAIGNVGTPTAIVSVPIVNEKKTLLFGAFTGAGVLRKSPPVRYVINFRASYAQETAAMVEGLVKERGIDPKDIAFFTQNDGYGNAGYDGAISALEKLGYKEAKSLVHGRYERNTINVEEALSEILDADPKAVIMVGAYKPCATFIKLAREEGLDALFVNVSFVGSKALANELGEDAQGVVVTQVVPHFDSDLPGIAAYRSALKTFDPAREPDFVSLEGYLAAKVFTEGLKKASTLDREGIVSGIESLESLDIGIGTKISLSTTNHQALEQVWPTVMRDGKWTHFSNWKTLQ